MAERVEVFAAEFFRLIEAKILTIFCDLRNRYLNRTEKYRQLN